MPGLAGFAAQPLSAALREQTRVAHDRAETAPSSGTDVRHLPLSAYTALAARNYAVYRQSEAAAGRWRSHPPAGPFVLGELSRVPHVEADLAQLLGGDWAARASRLRVPATVR